MATVLSGSNDKEKLDDLTSRPHKDQAVWFLNAFWEVWSPPPRPLLWLMPPKKNSSPQEFGEEAEKLWKFVHKAAELDEGKRHEGSDLDEFQAHRFLEHFHETLTVQARPAPVPPCRKIDQ